MVEAESRILEAAAQSFPIAIKSLDAIHLATALYLKKRFQTEVVVLTHDAKMAIAVTAMELAVVNAPL